MVTEEMIPAMQGIIPATLATSSKAGIPNVGFISQVFYVDESHVALSFQFFNKTVRNVRENPRASVRIYHPETFNSWDLEIKYKRSEDEGPVFDEMDMQLEAIASMTGMSGIFKLKSAEIYEVMSVHKNIEEKIQ